MWQVKTSFLAFENWFKLKKMVASIKAKSKSGIKELLNSVNLFPFTIFYWTFQLCSKFVPDSSKKFSCFLVLFSFSGYYILLQRNPDENKLSIVVDRQNRSTTFECMSVVGRKNTLNYIDSVNVVYKS
jgi:hypothetical protein